MNILGIGIGATGLLLLGMFMWMLALSIRKKRLEQERKEREIAHRKAIESHRQQEQQERIAKAEGGHIPTILYLAKEAERSRVKEAVYWYNKAAQLDNIAGMYGVVRISNAMKQDVVLKEQAKYWRLCIAAAEGSLPHQFEMAQALCYGRGVEVNLSKGLPLMITVAEQNHIEALLFLGDWFIADNNLEKDPMKSTQYYRKAAELRDNDGRMKLGISYLQGRGVNSNFERGIYWLERAAEKGHLESMYKLGEIWIDYKPNGRPLAYIWLFVASQLGYKQAISLRDQVALNIGVDIVVGLQSLAKPIVKKIRDNKVSKHSVIKALNKLYKRSIPIDEFEQSYSEPLDATGPIVSEVVETPPASKTLDFSQSPIDSNTFKIDNQ